MEHLSNYCSFIQITGAFPLSESRVSFIITESCSEETVGILEELIPEEWGGEGVPPNTHPSELTCLPNCPENCLHSIQNHEMKRGEKGCGDKKLSLREKEGEKTHQGRGKGQGLGGLLH